MEENKLALRPFREAGGLDLSDRLALRPARVAAVLEISRSKTYELLASGELPSVRIGSSVRVPVDALRQWLAQRMA